jgi:hypothetical protein
MPAIEALAGVGRVFKTRFEQKEAVAVHARLPVMD